MIKTKIQKIVGKKRNAVSYAQKRKGKKGIVKKAIIKEPLEEIEEEKKVAIGEIASQGEEVEAIKEAPVEEVKAEAQEEAPAEERVEELEKEITVAEAEEIVEDDEKVKWAQEQESLTTENASLQGEIERLKEEREAVVKDKVFLEAQLKIVELEKKLALRNADYETLREEKELLEAQIIESESNKPEPSLEIAEQPSQETQEAK